MRTKLLVSGVLLSLGFAMLAPNADARHCRRARSCGCAGWFQPAGCATGCGFQGGYAPATGWMPQNAYGAQTACAVPTDAQGAFNGGAGAYGSAGFAPDQGQGVQQTGGYQAAPPPPREIDNER